MRDRGGRAIVRRGGVKGDKLRNTGSVEGAAAQSHVEDCAVGGLRAGRLL